MQKKNNFIINFSFFSNKLLKHEIFYIGFLNK